MTSSFVPPALLAMNAALAKVRDIEVMNDDELENAFRSAVISMPYPAGSDQFEKAQVAGATGDERGGRNANALYPCVRFQLGGSSSPVRTDQRGVADTRLMIVEVFLKDLTYGGSGNPRSRSRRPSEAVAASAPGGQSSVIQLAELFADLVVLALNHQTLGVDLIDPFFLTRRNPPQFYPDPNGTENFIAIPLVFGFTTRLATQAENGVFLGGILTSGLPTQTLFPLPANTQAT